MWRCNSGRATALYLKMMHDNTITFGFSRPEQGVSILEVKDLALGDAFKDAPPARLVVIKSGGWGGNHKHSRREAFIACSSDLFVVWRDSAGTHEEQMMAADGTMRVFIVDPWVPHMVVNKGNHLAVLYEIMSHDDGPVTPLEGAEALR